MPDLGYWLDMRYTRESTLDWWSQIANTRGIPSGDSLVYSLEGSEKTNRDVAICVSWLYATSEL